MKLHFLFFFALIIGAAEPVFASGLDPQILDSLEQVWQDPGRHDTTRCEAMYNLILYGYLETEPDTAFLLAGTYREFARKKGLPRHEIQGMMLQGYSFSMKGDVETALTYFQESVVLSAKQNLKSTEAIATELIGQMLGSLGRHEEAVEYLQKSLAINLEQGDLYGLASSYNNLAVQYSNYGDYEQSLFFFHKSLEAKRRTGDSVLVANGLNNLGVNLVAMGRIEEAKALHLQAIKASSSPKNDKNVTYALYNLSSISVNEGKFEEALDYIQRTIELSKKTGDVWNEANAWTLIGAIHTRQGLYVQAMEELNTALSLHESINNQKGYAAVLGNIANVQLDQNAYAEALATYEKAKVVFEQSGDKESLSQVFSSMGNVYLEQNQPEEALKNYEASLAYAREISTPSLIAYALAHMADLYYRQNDLNKATNHIIEALKLSDTPETQLDHGDNLVIAGLIFLKAKSYSQAIAYGNKAYDIARKIGAIATLSSATELLYEAYKATGQTAKALEMFEYHITYRDSMVNEENTRAVFQQQMQYEFEKKEAATQAEQDKKDALAREEIARRNLQRNASLLGLGLVAVLAGVLYVNGRRRRQTNLLLSAQKAEIEAKSNQNELLLKEIHHRVKNSLQTISSLLHLQSAHIKDEDVRQAVAEGQHRVESMALIHQKLYQRDNLAAIEMRDYLGNLVQSLIHTFDADPDRIRFDLSMPELELDVDTAVPLGLIVNELITNSLKYAFPDGRGGTITVSLRKTDNQLELLVADDGVGKANTATGTSFGSQLVQLLTMQLGGKLEQGTNEGFWTRVRV